MLRPVIEKGNEGRNNSYFLSIDNVLYVFRLYEWNKTKYVSFYIDDICCVTFTLGENSFCEISLLIDSLQIIETDDFGNRFEGCSLKSYTVGSFYNKENILTFQGIKKAGLEIGFGISYYEDIMSPTIKYIGFYLNGKKNGFGILFDRSGNKNGIIGMGGWLDDCLLKSDFFTLSSNEDFEKVSQNIKKLFFMDNSFENVPLTERIAGFTELQSLNIGKNCFKNVPSLSLSHFKFLEDVHVCRESFLPPVTQPYLKSLLSHILEFNDLPSLKKIIIEMESFSWIQQLILCDLPNLEYLELGSIKSEPWNPKYGTFELTTKLQLKSMIHTGCFQSIDLKSLKTVIIGDYSFNKVTSVVFAGKRFKSWFNLDLPNLQSLSVGRNGLNGSTSYSTYFINCPSLNEINLGEEAMMNCSDVFFYSTLSFWLTDM